MKQGLWSRRVVPFLVEKACRSSAIKAERERWVPRAHGRVLEIGVGSGLNLAFYDPARVTQLEGVDPSAELLDRARRRAADAPLSARLTQCGAESLPFEAESFDSAVVTYSLCSVDSPGDTLAEAWRVLKPGGELFFVEHGLAPDAGPAGWQRRLAPAWAAVGGGCRLERDPIAALGGAGFSVEEITTEYAPDGPRWLSFTYQGMARRP